MEKITLEGLMGAFPGMKLKEKLEKIDAVVRKDSVSDGYPKAIADFLNQLSMLEIKAEYSVNEHGKELKFGEPLPYWLVHAERHGEGNDMRIHYEDAIISNEHHKSWKKIGVGYTYFKYDEFKEAMECLINKIIKIK